MIYLVESTIDYSHADGMRAKLIKFVNVVLNAQRRPKF